MEDILNDKEEPVITEYSDKINKLNKKYDDMVKHFHQENGKMQGLIEMLENNKFKLIEFKKNLELYEKVKILLISASESCRIKTKVLIEDFVTNCLQYIFETDILFEIEFIESRGRTEAEFYIISEYSEQSVKTLPQDSRGGGVVDVVSIALRVAMLEFGNEVYEGPIIFDEPFKHLSDDYINRAAYFLKHIGLQFDRQILMVTHNRYLSEIADVSFLIENINGTSLIKKQYKNF